jgi:two-component sensor histidine kinase
MTERRLALDALLENMAEGFAMCEAIWDADGNLSDYVILELNTALQRMLGVGPEVVGSKLGDGPGDHLAWLGVCERVLKTGAPTSFEVHTRRVNLWHEIRVTRVDENTVAQLFFDVTERKRAEARQASLFDELNHRVSNNLMLVTGILQMKANETNSAEVRDQLLRAVARIESIAQVHRALYRGPGTDVVDFAVYLEDLCAGVGASLVRDGQIELKVEAEPLSMPIDTAIPLGMVVNELVTNAVKYAYPEGQGGPVYVHSTREGDGLLLSVRDLGRGLPRGAGQKPGSGLGMKLVRSLVAQIGGDLVSGGPPGTTFEVRVPGP